MKYLGAILLAVGLLYGANDIAIAADAHFTITDVPGYWYDTGVSIGGTRSLAIIAPGETVHFHQAVESRHTVTGLIWPTAAGAQPIDQPSANMDDHSVTLNTLGLYVFVCKLHPYMLGAVIVDDNTNPGLEIGDSLHLLAVGDVPSYSDLSARLLRAFFLVTNPDNWKDYRRVGSTYLVSYPSVDVRVFDGASHIVANLNDTLQGVFPGTTIPAPKKPTVKGVGEVWVDTQFELSFEKGSAYPGAMTAVTVGATLPANNWKVRRKVALPSRLMNNGHNMWASHNQNILYQTEWHGQSLFVIDRVTGKFLREIEVGADPAHVMTRVDTQQVHVGLNGDDYVVELNKVPAPEYLQINRYISMQDPNNLTNPTQPHAHWMGFNGKHMVTPNANTGDSTLYAFDPLDPNQGVVISKQLTGALSIATGMMPDSSKYYVSNYLGHNISVMCGPINGPGSCTPGNKIKDISLLQGYVPGAAPTAGCGTGGLNCVDGLIGGLPIQTPVSPDGKFVVTGNTLGGTITIVRTSDDTVVKILSCDPGCHGVNFGAKKGGGYYAYVTSKFANRLIVLDYDKNNDGDATDAEIAGWVVLADDIAPRDAWINENLGQGGQGVLPVPNVYNGWVQKLPATWKLQLTTKQRNPFP